MEHLLSVPVKNNRLTLFRLDTEPFRTNTYLMQCAATKEHALIDAAGGIEQMMQKLGPGRLKYILLTHAHPDHFLALEEWKNTVGSAIIAAHGAEVKRMPLKPDQLLQGGEVLKVGTLTLKVLFTPGHTPGGLSFLTEDMLFVGDTIFPGGPGKTVSSAALKTLLASIKNQVLTLPGHTLIFPGHGEPSSINELKPRVEKFIAQNNIQELYGDLFW